VETGRARGATTSRRATNCILASRVVEAGASSSFRPLRNARVRLAIFWRKCLDAWNRNRLDRDFCRLARSSRQARESFRSPLASFTTRRGSDSAVNALGRVDKHAAALSLPAHVRT